MSVHHGLVPVLLVIQAFIYSADAQAAVHYITPRHGSLNGETRITLHGIGFAPDQFEQDKGNEVTLVDDYQSYACEVHKDGSTEKQIQCYSPKIPEGDYRIVVKVDGREIPEDKICEKNSKENCKFKPRESVTPIITAIEPRSGLPGTVVTIHGKVLTTKSQSNEAESTNGRTETIRRVYFGGQKCELRKPDSDELYGIKLNNGGTSVWGHIKCKLQGSYIGNINASFIIEGTYGRSQPKLDSIKVSAQNKIAMFQTYAEIKSVSPSVGSTAGETVLTIGGNYFDETNAPAKVLVDGAPCKVVHVDDKRIDCRTPPNQPRKSVYPGNRGVLIEYWNGTTYYDSRTVGRVASLTPSNFTYQTLINDSAYFSIPSERYASRMTGFFVPPSSGIYRLFLLADDVAELYFSETDMPENKTLIANCPRYANNYDKFVEQKSRKMKLQGGRPYYLEVLHYQGTHHGDVKVGAYMHSTTYNEKQTSQAFTETQKIVTTSKVVEEVQTITLNNWSRQPTVKEIQTISITGSVGKFQIRLDGVATGLLDFPATADVVQAALNSLPVIHPDTVSVKKTSSGNTHSYRVTFNSDRGDMRLMEVEGGITLVATVTKTTPGVSSMQQIQLELGGIPSVPVRMPASAEDIQNAIYSMLSGRCPVEIIQPAKKPEYFEDFENGTKSLLSGTRVYHNAFCGRKSVLNPGLIFRGKVDPKKNKYLCIAYRGKLNNRLTLDYSFLGDDKMETSSTRFNLGDKFDTDPTMWQYKCIDLLPLLLPPKVQRPFLSLKKIYLSRSGDVFVDTVSISETKPIADDQLKLLSTRRMSLADKMPISGVSVTASSGLGPTTYNVTFTAYKCSHMFPKIMPYNAKEQRGRPTYMQNSWTAGATMDVQRLRSASPPVGGTFDILYKGERIRDIPANVTSVELKEILDASGVMGVVNVQRDGDCSGYSWIIKFLSDAGDQPEMQVDTKMVRGVDVKLAVTTVKDGGLLLSPIPGDMLRTPETRPQVSLFINDIPSVCTRGVCNYEWSVNATPEVMSVDVTKCTFGDNITVSGTGFDDSNITNNVIRIGKAPCKVQSATASNVTCTIGPGPSGEVPVMVRVIGKGKAVGHHMVNYTASITSVTPSSSDTGGGLTITIDGVGFKDGFLVEINGSACTDANITSTVITCDVPPAESAGVAKLILLDTTNGSIVDTSPFTYTSPSAIITAVNITRAHVDGSTVIAINGTGFGGYNETVNILKIGNTLATIISYNDTSVIARLPPKKSGMYTIRLRINIGEYADIRTNRIPPISYRFEVNSISPNEGSVFGGSKLTISGHGFTMDRSLYNITIGAVGCRVVEAKANKIKCVMDQYYRTHHVTNMGTNPRFGKGYYWNPVSLSIEEGDKVHWSWEVPKAVTGVEYRVCQTANSTATKCLHHGFNSGIKSPRGSTARRFFDLGDHYYWSDFVEGSRAVSFRGVIRVKPKGSKFRRVIVKVNNVTADAVRLHGRHARSAPVCPAMPRRSYCARPPAFGFSNGSQSHSNGFNFSHGGNFTFNNNSHHFNFSHGKNFTVNNSSHHFNFSHGKNITVNNSSHHFNFSHGKNFTVNNSSHHFNFSHGQNFTVNNSSHNFNFSHGQNFTVNNSSHNFNFSHGQNFTVNNSSSHHFNFSHPIRNDSLYNGSGDFNFKNQSQDTLGFTFTKCATPVIRQIDTRKESDRYVVHVLGESLGEQPCQIKASFLSEPLNVTHVSSDGSNVTLHFVPSGNISIGVRYDKRLVAEMNVYGLGLAQFDLRGNEFEVFHPSVSGLQPMDGSCEGGALLTLRGMHLMDPMSRPSVYLTGAGTCTIVSSSHREIQCRAPPLTPGTPYEVTVTVTTPNGPFTANSSVPLKFTCSRNSTPAIYDASPARSDGRVPITITGTGFGSDPSMLQVRFGYQLECNVTSSNDTVLTCTLPHSLAGMHKVSVSKSPVGFAAGNVSVHLEPTVDSISSAESGTNGGKNVTISGAGFNPDSISVTVDGTPIAVASKSRSEVELIIPAHGDGTVPIQIISDGIPYPAVNFTYRTSLTPAITGINPSQGSGGDQVIISGSGFDQNCINNAVIICGEICSPTICTTTSITCNLGHCPSGAYDVMAMVDGKGKATSSTGFTYTLSLTSVQPLSGSYAGGQLIQIVGLGLDGSNTRIEICGSPCKVMNGSSNNVACATPSASGPMACDVVVFAGTLNVTHIAQYRYEASLTPTVTLVTPRRGGTGGGTNINITGTNFGTDANATNVNIESSPCAVLTVTDTSITCTTGPHRPSVLGEVVVTIGTDGNSFAAPGDAVFHYIDLWSSPFTWGAAKTLPVAGDMVVVPAGQTMVVDMDTPVIKMLLIKGGTVLFDQKDVELNAENILIIDGGTLQIGTEEEPHLHKATINLHGNLRAIELPIYGAKCLAVRNGTLDLHGKPIESHWTVLDATANASTNTLVVQHNVSDWGVGSTIAIATTGERHSQRENEKLTIAAISSDGYTITLNESLKYTHLGVENIVDGVNVQIRAEVGLLSHNIVFRGSNDPMWNVKIAACPAGFNTGEFATQTCFQGRFGEEMGSDQFGAHIMMHAPRPDEGLVTGRIENVELTYVGQAFRLGRYPIHFHLNGNQNGSYVRGCGMHKTFNRAVNIHGTHNVLVEHTVIYDIMGGAFFLEDGIETGNTFQYNLALFVKSSTSLLNDDITPASFWITNPNNTVRHNVAAGGTHFGYWYRMHTHPDGPSFTNQICPKKVPLGEFRNNSAHSFGWFGVWIFQDYFPMEGGCCSCNVPKPAVFEGLTAWNNEKGAESVNGGALHFKNCLLFNNEKAGIEMKTIKNAGLYSTATGSVLENNHIIGHVPALSTNGQCTKRGIVAPFARGLIAIGTKFANFDRQGCSAFGVASIDGTCKVLCGGWRYDFYNTSWTTTPNKVAFRWEHEAIIKDVDGTFSGTPNTTIVPKSGHFPRPACQNATGDLNRGVPAMQCDSSVKFHRMAFNKPKPSFLDGKDVLLDNVYGSSFSSYAFKRLTHKSGWMILLAGGVDTKMLFKDSDHITNISYTGKVYDLEENDCIIVTHNLTQRPDKFQIIPGQNANSTEAMVNCGDNTNGDYYFENATKELHYLISGRDPVSKRSISAPRTKDRTVNLHVYQCYYPGCALPAADRDSPDNLGGRPSNATKWSDLASWDAMDAGWGGNYANGTFGPPKDGDNVKIRHGYWVVVDGPLPRLNKLFIYGVLEFDNRQMLGGGYLNTTLSATHIIVNGGRLIAGYDAPGEHFQGNLDIVLRGDHLTEEIVMEGGPVIGAKALGVFGGLDLHGVPRGSQWTKLGATAAAGSDRVTLRDDVDWVVGDKIMITTSSFDGEETELRTITGISGRTMVLDSRLRFDHKVVEARRPELAAINKTFTLAAEVGLLNRNIRVIGGDYPDVINDAFGARVIIGTSVTPDNILRGWARISNVEFHQGGQLGHSDSYDPRYAVAWLDTGDVNVKRPSYLVNSTFHHTFATAIGVFGAGMIPIENNVVHRAVGPAVIVEGNGNMIRNNLIAAVTWQGGYNGRKEAANLNWDAGIQVNSYVDLIMEGNVVAGSQRSGYQIMGEPCGTPSLWRDNEAHGVLTGILQLPDESRDPCAKISNFLIWRAFDFGIYTQGKNDMEIENVIVSDSRLGIFNIEIGQGSLSHICDKKTVIIRNSLVVGDSGGLSCIDTLSGTNVDVSGQARPWLISGGWTGVGWFSALSAANNAPQKPFIGSMSYPTLCGLMQVRDTTFYGFNANRCSRRNFAMSTNPSQEDILHPIYVENIGFIDVDEGSKVFYHRASIGAVNPSDCVDMVCDAKQHCFIRDIDGSFLGKPGNILPQAEYEWNGDPRRGVGDYRIPKVALTDPTGRKLDVRDVAPYKGIIGHRNCTYMPTWQAHKCHNDLDYAELAIENLDSDTETRRLSPVAVISEKYVDLLNGPQDMGWCAGYTCQKRISTFWALVALEKHYDIYFTSTSPSKLRLTILNARAQDTVRVGIYYRVRQRLDVLHNNQYIEPTNAGKNSLGQAILNAPTYKGHYVPPLSAAPGSNYFDKDYGLLYIVIRGDVPVEVHLSPLVVVAFNLPAMTVDEFFGKNVVGNLAAFLGISPEQIRVVEAVSESSRRRKRATATFKVTLEIGDPPSGGNTTNITAPALTSTQLSSFGDVIADAVQNQALSSALNTTILSVSVTPPAPQPGTPEWSTYVDEVESGNITSNMAVPTTLVLVQTPVSAGECIPFTSQPWLRFTDSDGNLVENVGTQLTPWVVEAKLTTFSGSPPGVTLTGNTTATFIDGYARFTDLGISHPGADYVINFELTSPSLSPKKTTGSSPITIQKCQLELRNVSAPSVMASLQSFGFSLAIVEKTSGNKPDMSKYTSWDASIALESHGTYPGPVQGNTVGTVDTSIGNVNFTSLAFATKGRYLLGVTARTTDHELKYSFKVDVVPSSGYVPPPVEVTKRCKIRFPNDYSTIQGKEDAFEATVYNKLAALYPKVIIDNFIITSGSVIVSFDVKGQSTVTTDVITLMAKDLKAFSFSFGGYTFKADGSLTVDGTIYGNDKEPESHYSRVDIIVSSVVPCAVVLVAIIVLGYCIMRKKKEKARISSPPPRTTETLVMDSDSRAVYDLWRLNGHYPVVLVDGRNGDVPPAAVYEPPPAYQKTSRAITPTLPARRSTLPNEIKTEL